MDSVWRATLIINSWSCSIAGMWRRLQVSFPGILTCKLCNCKNGPLVYLIFFATYIYLKASNIFLVTVFFNGISLKVYYILLCNDTDADTLWISVYLLMPFWNNEIFIALKSFQYKAGRSLSSSLSGKSLGHLRVPF